MLRLYVTFIAIFITLCSQANEFSVDPFEVYITHPQTTDEKGTLRIKKHVLLTFPYGDDIIITNIVNDARKQNKLLKFIDYTDQNYPDQLTRVIQIHDYFPYDLAIEFDPSNIFFHGSKRINLLGITINNSYIEYKNGNRTKTIYIYFNHVEDYLASIVAKAKEENRKIMVNTEGLRHPKKQQYVPLNFLAYLQ